MGKIDKEKLLKECKCLTDGYKFTYCMNQCNRYTGGENFQECITKVIKNFPEEPEIDFDALWIDFDTLWNDFYKTKCDGKACSGCEYNNKAVSDDRCFTKFLKSKHLTAPKLFELPVKKTWTLKKELSEYNSACGVMHDEDVTPSEYPQFFDLHEEPDYSKIPKGSIVELKSDDGVYVYRKVSHVDSEGIHCFFEDYKTTCPWNKSKLIRVVELAKEIR